jgi:glycosyltransferase involved in cell wall biosynthesis
MKENIIITILTATYNRKKYLPKLFDSLCKQTDQKFQWLVVDDGSTDGTEEWFQFLPETEFTKEYYKKANGGKHTALNYAHPYIKGELTFIVDSDDTVTSDAVETIKKAWDKYAPDPNICGLTFLCGYDKHSAIGNVHFEKDGMVCTSIEAKINAKKCVDSAEVIRTDVLKEFRFPEFENEKFMAESYLWNLSGYRYKTVYFNQIIYIANYLEDGLTKRGRPLRIKCPRGGVENERTYFDARVCSRQRIKHTWLYICFGMYAGYGYKKIIRNSGQKMFTIVNYPFGWALKKYWDIKYRRGAN